MMTPLLAKKNFCCQRQVSRDRSRASTFDGSTLDVCADKITIGPITCGGYTVSAAWLLYLLWCISFEDPLKVLAAREAARVA